CFYYEKPYVLEPGKSDKSYVLLRETLRNTNTVGIARIVIRTRQYIAALMPRDAALVVNLLRFPREIKDLSQFDLPKGDLEDLKVSKKEIDFASHLLEAMRTKWNPQDYSDDYRQRLNEYIEGKLEKGKVKRKH